MKSLDVIAKKSGEFCAARIVIDLCETTEKTYYLPLFYGVDYLARAAVVLNDAEIIASIRVPLDMQCSARGVVFRHGVDHVSRHEAILWGQPNKGTK